MCMQLFKKPKKKKKFLIPIILILVVVGIGLLIEPFLLKTINKQAKTANPQFKGHVKDLDLHILTASVELEDITAKLKSNGRKFLDVKEVEVDLSWKKLFKGDIAFDVMVDTFNFAFASDLQEAIKKLPKPEEKKKKELPFSIGEIEVKSSRIAVLGLPGIDVKEDISVRAINGNIRNISGDKDSKLGNYDFKANFLGQSKIVAKGNFDIAAETPRWDTDFKLTNFDLKSINQTLRSQIPVTYKHGTLDVYSEVKSESGKIYGYVKPFLNDVQYMGNNKEFKSADHFLIEVLGATSNWMLENKDKETVATRVPFIYKDGKFQVETGVAIKEAVAHGFFESDEVKKGIEKKYRLNAPNPKEVQAQEEKIDRKPKKKD